jgi:hypothetical protein
LILLSIFSNVSLPISLSQGILEICFLSIIMLLLGEKANSTSRKEGY